MNAAPTLTEKLINCMLRTGIPAGFQQHLTPDMEDNLIAYVSSSAWSTLEGFRTDISRWFTWTSLADVDPLAPRARDIRDYISIFEEGRKPSTVKRMVVNIGVLVSGICGRDNPTHTKIVRAEIKRIYRDAQQPSKQALAIRQKGHVLSFDDPASPFSIERMLSELEQLKTLPSLRAQLILSLGGDTGRRHGEYIDATWAHLVEASDGTGTFMIPSSKTDQQGEGIVRFTSRRTMRIAREWREARIDAGQTVAAHSPIFVAVDQHGNPGEKKMTSSGFHIALRWGVRTALTEMAADRPELANEIEDILVRISGHSFRVGMVQDFIIAGESIPSICIEGGWQTANMAILYGRNLAVQNGASARLRRRLGDE